MPHNAPHILHVFSSLELGGAQRRFITYLAHSGAGFRHSVYAMDGNYDALKLTDKVKAPNGGAQQVSPPVIPKGNTLAAVRACRRYLAEMRPDLMITYNWGATEWVLANKFMPICPMIHIQDGFTADEQTRELRSRRMMRAFAYKSCKAVVVPSLTLEQHVSKNWGIKPERLKFIPNGIDIDRFICPAHEDFARSLGIDTSQQIIGTVAGLRPEKNIGRLIEAFSHVEDSHPGSQLVIVGEGVGMSALKMLAERVCKRGAVIFTGGLPHPEHILPAFNLFALSSNTEQMPLSVIEAMAAGLAVVSPNVGDIRQMVCDANKDYIAGNSAKILAENLNILLQSPDVANRIGAANQAKAKADYSLDTMVETYDQLFRRCMG
jgi:glycosyltransferase involved in cell wall biosynthesis